MALMMLEIKWKAALVSILEELTEEQFSKLLFKLDTIPQAVKSGKTREDIPHIIIQYYGTEKSITVIDKEMKLLPRNDAAVQQLLLPFVEKLKKIQQKIKKKKSKVTTESGPVAKKPKAAADTLKSCRPDEMLPSGALKPQQTVTQESSVQPTGSMETKMALRMFEAKWTAALVSILEELTEPQFSKLLFKLDSIPQGLKSGRTREDIPHIIVQYYGTEESISVIDKEMKQIPRNDAAVQQLLLPFVENLKKKQQKIKEKKSKVTTESGPVTKKPKAAADTLKSCRPDEMLPFGAVKPQQTMTQESSMQPTGSMETKMLPFGAVKPQQTMTQESFMQPTGSMETKMLPFGAVKPQQTVTQESSMQPTGSMETKMLPFGAVKPQQTMTQESFMQPTGSMETKMLPFGAVKPQQTVTQESSMQPTGSMETKMTLMMLEAEWKAALVSILKELTEQQFSKLLFKLDTIPQAVKFDKTRQDIPHIIVQYYGTEESISVIDKEMKLLPRNDAAVQQLLLPFVEKLKKKKQKKKKKKSKVTTESGPVAKKPKAAADTLKSCRPDEMLPFGAVKPQQTMTQESFMQPTGSMETKMVPVGAVKPPQTVTQESFMQATGSMETKVQSAAVQTGRITLIRIKRSNKFYTHLVVEFNDRLQTVFVTTRLLANAFGYIANDDFMERFSYEIPLTAEAKIQGNKIIEIKNR